MGIVDEAVEDGVSEGGISDSLVPVLDRKLACDDGGAATMAILQDFQQIASLGLGEGNHLCGCRPLYKRFPTFLGR